MSNVEFARAPLHIKVIFLCGVFSVGSYKVIRGLIFGR